MELNVSFAQPWRGLLENHQIEARFECWVDKQVFCFNETGPLKCYEESNLFWTPQPLEHVPANAPFIVTYNGNAVAWFQTFEAFSLRLYFHMPESPTQPQWIPHHVADALLYRRGFACNLTGNLYAHADAPWVKPTPAVYGTAFLQHDLPLHETSHEDDMVQCMATVFTESIYPDLIWLDQHKENYMHPSIWEMPFTPPFQSLTHGPIVNMARACKTDLPEQLRAQFCATSGATAGSVWRLNRGKDVPPASREFLEARITEAINLRGRRDPDAWNKEFGHVARYETVADQVEEFKHVVANCLIGPNPIRPGGFNKGVPVLHHWLGEALENVYYALGSLAISRRYIFDHRWVPKKKAHYTGMFHHDVDYVLLTDENTLAFTINGDCEDANSVIYYLALQMIQETYPKGSLLYYARICLIICGVPCCVSGSSLSPSTHGDEKAEGSHLYGFSIPHRIFAQMLYGDIVPISEIKIEMEQLAGCVLSEFVIMAAVPMVMETIMWSTATYHDPATWKWTDHIKYFNTFKECMIRKDEDLVFPRVMGANWPLSITRKDPTQGFIIHGRIMRLFTAALPLMFSRTFRERYTAHELNFDSDDTLSRPNTAVDPCLDDTISFVPLSYVTSPDRKYNEPAHISQMNNVGILTLSLYDKNVHARLVTCKRITPRVKQAEACLLQHDRPFVTIHNPVDISKALEYVRSHYVNVPRSLVLPTHAHQRFTTFIYADRVERGESYLDALLCTPAFRNKTVTFKQFCWSIAAVIALN